MEYKKKLLLIGAGFTKNFGGFLAKEISDILFNNPERKHFQKINDLIQNNFDYEDIYYQVLTQSKFGEEEKSFIKNAVIDAYERNEKQIQNTRLSHKINTTKINRLIGNFNGNKASKGFVFSLNQDLFFEKNFINVHRRPSLPGLPSGDIYKYYEENTGEKVIKEIQLDNSPIKLEQLGKFNLIKLHGSCDWRDSQNEHMMIIGKDKIKTIDNIPILKSYYDIFEKVLLSGKVKLLVFGYGFGDSHVNTILAEAKRKYKLEIHLITNEERNIVKGKLDQIIDGDTIYDSIHGIYKPTELYPNDHDIMKNEKERQLIENFFDGNYDCNFII